MPNVCIEGREHDLGHGLMVRRSLPSDTRRAVGPFVFWDHAGPVRLNLDAKRQLDIRPHPHIGLSTLSYLLSGAIVHRDNLGCEQIIRPGEVNWMTAGRGVVHSERFDDPAAFTGVGLELLQSWVALPQDAEEVEPGFTHYAVEALPQSVRPGVWMRLIAGTAMGMQSPVNTYSPLFYLHTRLEPKAVIRLPDEYSERAFYVVHGRVVTESDGHEYGVRKMILLDPHGETSVRALEPSVVMFLGGEPLGKRLLWWNFVSSRPERIRQAAADWRAGRFRLPDSDNHEFIPLPEGPIP
ncbi:MAG: pirin family protein [Proteobacteria bacterium]|nr:pirin family protein [Pseudomonadota bacterium]